MIRQCFLCQNPVEVQFSTTWALPGLAAAEIGFSVCPCCGSISQSPTVSPDDMMRYYSAIASYTNPGRAERPSVAKIRDLDEQIPLIKRAIGYLPERVLQIGSSDGYTLYRFREAGAKQVLGIEPGSASADIARRLYDIPCIISDAESVELNEDYPLILITHVLEHLYDPQSILRKCRQLQDRQAEAFIYIEVPLLAPLDSLLPGFFSFEHINYYSRNNLLESLLRADYSPISIIEHNTSNLSPIIGIVASTRRQTHYSTTLDDPEKNKTLLCRYRQRELHYWQQRLDRHHAQLQQAQNRYIWGAGIHTSQLLANTRLLEQYHIKGLVDSSSLKWGLRQGDWLCQAPDSIHWQNGDTIIISSYASEKEIYDALGTLRERGVSTLRLHDIDDAKAH